MDALSRAVRWFIGRLDSIFGTYQPPERRALLWLAVQRATLTAVGAMALWHVQAEQGWNLWIRVGLLPWDASLLAVISADFVEPLIRRGLSLLPTYRAFGPLAYNPYVSAIGEWEGWMGPTDADYAEAWDDVKCGPPPPGCTWWGDTESFCK